MDTKLYFDNALNKPDEHDARNGDFYFSFILHPIAQER